MTPDALLSYLEEEKKKKTKKVVSKPKKTLKKTK